MDQKYSSKTILFIMMKQALLQQYLLHIQICCILQNYYFGIAINGLTIIFFLSTYHLYPFTQQKIKYLIEYSLLSGLQIFTIVLQQALIYTASLLLGYELLQILLKICKSTMNVEHQLGIFKLCISILKCFLSLQLLFFTLHLNQIIPWNWIQIFVIFWFILVCGLLFQICLTFNLIYKFIKRQQISYEIRQLTLIKFYGGIWYTIQFHCLTVNPFLTLLNLCLSLDYQNPQLSIFYITIIGWILSIIITIIIWKDIKIYYIQTFIIKNQIVTNEDNFINENIPKYLWKVSSTYFQQIPEKPFEILATSPRKQTESVETKCIICYENESGYVLMNCGHGGLCLKCAQKNFCSETRECYLCRQPIQKILQVSNKGYNFVEVVKVIETQCQ